MTHRFFPRRSTDNNFFLKNAGRLSFISDLKEASGQHKQDQEFAASAKIEFIKHPFEQGFGKIFFHKCYFAHHL